METKVDELIRVEGVTIDLVRTSLYLVRRKLRKR